MTPAETDTLVRQLISGDPAAVAAILARATTSTEPLVLTAAALLAPATPELLDRAVAAATDRLDRQLTALAAAHLAGDRDRVTALAREHLLDHPGSVLAAWIAAGATTHADHSSIPSANPLTAGTAPAPTSEET
ncbi:hypothetical protein LL946_10665 [Knoellia locipacati]|uniref:hypothetical protein n=1 Tax=Knoellia locipacati TaxID=882824 RepID=UPI00384D76C6